ncbi:MAG: acyl-CoA dehydratase activase [bacterium]
MRFAGIDIGSRTIKLVVVEDNNIVEERLTASGYEPLQTATSLLDENHYDRLVATGYGRHLLEIARDIQTVTEIKAYARGARAALPDCRTVLDIGGQDMKAIALSSDGRVLKFEMNERCAAGSGKFLEIMAETLGYTIEEFGAAAQEGKSVVSISSVCTVFAESEVTTLLHKGTSREDIALAVHTSVVTRAVGMLRRVSLAESVVFAGGAARNSCLHFLLENALGLRVCVPEKPQMLGAYGVALIAQERETGQS